MVFPFSLLKSASTSSVYLRSLYEGRQPVLPYLQNTEASSHSLEEISCSALKWEHTGSPRRPVLSLVLSRWGMLWEKSWRKNMTVDWSLPLLYLSSVPRTVGVLWRKKWMQPNKQMKPLSKYWEGQTYREYIIIFTQVHIVNTGFGRRKLRHHILLLNISIAQASQFMHRSNVTDDLWELSSFQTVYFVSIFWLYWRSGEKYRFHRWCYSTEL